MALVPVTQVRVYNRALALVGSVNRSTNTNDGKTWTDTLNEHWATAVRELLAAHPWNCAIKRATLNKGAAPDWGDGYSYQLPADCLRWLPQAKDSSGCDLAATREGGALVADGGAQIFVRYIALIEDLTAWAPHMVSALGYRLAYDAAEALTQSSVDRRCDAGQVRGPGRHRRLSRRGQGDRRARNRRPRPRQRGGAQPHAERRVRQQLAPRAGNLAHVPHRPDADGVQRRRAVAVDARPPRP
jgi:hypothetical protein